MMLRIISKLVVYNISPVLTESDPTLGRCQGGKDQELGNFVTGCDGRAAESSQVIVGDHRDFDRVSTCELVEQSPASRNPSQFGRWIQALQFEAGIHRAETPVDHGMVVIALGLPRIDFSA